jgi:hypothetical protein
MCHTAFEGPIFRYAQIAVVAGQFGERVNSTEAV